MCGTRLSGGLNRSEATPPDLRRSEKPFRRRFNADGVTEWLWASPTTRVTPATRCVLVWPARCLVPWLGGGNETAFQNRWRASYSAASQDGSAQEPHCAKGAPVSSSAVSQNAKLVEVSATAEVLRIIWHSRFDPRAGCQPYPRSRDCAITAGHFVVRRSWRPRCCQLSARETAMQQ